MPIEFTPRDSWETFTGTARDISLGGMYIATDSAAPFGTEVFVRIRVPGRRDQMVLPGVVRWRGDDGMGIQFGMLGARETHAITQMQIRKEKG
jgi:type IV pilus assembly protein PilZ